MLNGIHFLLTYACPFECDHCFLYCTPKEQDVFTLKQIRQVLDDAAKIESMEWIYFEGGEAFLYYPLMVEGLRLARDKGYKTGIVTNCYWATTEEDAELWLKPVREAGIDDLSLSDDAYHQGDADEQANTARKALRAAQKLNMPVSAICIDQPKVESSAAGDKSKGQPVIGGGAMMRGRAADKLTEGQPLSPYHLFTSCPHEELRHPERLHVDPLGHVHICQGISMGNMWDRPLSEMVGNYRAENHPICGPLIEGGPALLAKTYDIEAAPEYVDACHFCFLTRRALIDRFPQYLAPRHVYGLE